MALSRDWAKPVREALLRRTDDAPGKPRFIAKFASDNNPVLHGTTAFIPNGLRRSMEAEFKQNEEGKWWGEYEYVVNEVAKEEPVQVYSIAPVHMRDKGHAGWTLADFAATPQACHAQLTQAEVAALRLYTSTAFECINSALRSCNAKVIEQWATTVSLLTSAIIKLSALSPLDQACYRSLPADFPALRTLSGSTAAETIVDTAIMSCSLDVDYIAFYNGSKHTEGTVLVFESTFSSRGADISWLSQFPEQAEVTFPPCTALQVVAVERVAGLPKYIALVRPQICAMRHFTDGLRFPWSSPTDPLSHAEYDAVLAADRRGAAQSSSAGKFGGEMREMVTGEPKLAALGLEAYLDCDMPQVLAAYPGSPGKVAAIEHEFRRAEDPELMEWLDYVRHQEAASARSPWGQRDEGHDGMRLHDFCQHPEAKRARLLEEHVLALRLYTCTPVSFKLNAPLRAFKTTESGELAHPVAISAPYAFPATVFLIHEAIKRLRDVEGDQEVTLWRGAKNIRVAADFLRGGGVEMAPMSTSYSIDTALAYSRSPNSILFKIVTRSFMERGADVAWLSAFPAERECLFPPLTFLSPTGRVQKVGECFTVVEVTPRM